MHKALLAIIVLFLFVSFVLSLMESEAANTAGKVLAVTAVAAGLGDAFKSWSDERKKEEEEDKKTIELIIGKTPRS